MEAPTPYPPSFFPVDLQPYGRWNFLARILSNTGVASESGPRSRRGKMLKALFVMILGSNEIAARVVRALSRRSASTSFG
jgi:hypothetical protein